MTCRFSPGPWVASDRTDEHEVYSAAYPGRPICHVGSYWKGPGPNRDERAANAAVIAAAPQLVEAVAVAAAIFREYEQLHRDKGTPDGNDKAERNARAAVVMEAVLKQAGVDQ